MKLTEEMINSLVADVGAGLSNQDAAKVNGISKRIFYDWLDVASTVRETGKKRLTMREKLCIQLVDKLEAAKLNRKKRLIQNLDESNSPAGSIFLLKQLHPQEFNKEPVPIPNFQKLESFMAEEYTQSEIEAIRKAIHAAEQRRQSDVRYAEDKLFGDDDE